MVLKALSDYIETLCRRHILLKHSDNDCHFVNLNDDKKQTFLSEKMHYPGVFFSVESGYRLNGTDVGLTRNYTCRIEVWYHVEDTANYFEIEQKLSQANEILIDILALMINDKRKRSVPVLMGVNLNGCQVLDIENKSNALYGCYIDFPVPTSMCVTDRLKNFADIGQFDATFTPSFD